jgi:hypothetical protein
MFIVLRKGFLILLAIALVALFATVALGADALFGKALRAWGPYAFGGQPVEFADSELAIFGGRASVADFHAGTAKDPLLDLARGGLEVDILAAFSGRVHVRNAELVGTRLHFRVREDGTLAVDPGPPPAEERRKQEPAPRETPLPKPENRDIVQIVGEYWERYQTYKDYYDRAGGVFAGGGGEEEEEPKAAPARFPGKPEFVAAAQARDRAEREARGAFYLERAAIEDFRWETLDARTGKAILPELKSFTFALERVGSAPEGVSEPALIRGAGELTDGGTLDFALHLSRTSEPSTLDFGAVGLPADQIVELAKVSLPFRVAGGTLDLKTQNLRFDSKRLRGKIRVALNGAKVLPKKTSPQVLGVEPQEFCRLLNEALAQAPVAFSITLGGTPTRPTFDVENETDLGDLLGGAVKAEVQRRAGALLEEKQDELKQKVGEELGDRLGEEASGLLEGVLGGEKPKDKLKVKPKGEKPD